MKKNKFLKSITFIQCTVLMLLVSSINVSAETHMNILSCANKHSGSNLSACLDTVKNNVDKELVIWVNNQSFVLDAIKQETGRGAALRIFNRSMSRFNSYREDNCRWKYLSIAPEKGADIAYKTCYIELTQTKINELSKSSQ